LTKTFGSSFNRLITKSCYSTRGTDPVTSPKRGDHVINNSVLSVYQDIIKRFLQTHLRGTSFDTIIKDLGESGTSSQIYKGYNHAIDDQAIVTSIQKDMVVDFTASENYKDTNAKPYGEAVEELRQSAISYMKELYDTRSGNLDTKKAKSAKAVQAAIGKMNSGDLYVDIAAKNKYLKDDKKGAKKTKYDTAHTAVNSMFTSLYDKLKLWAKDIKTAVANSKRDNYKKHAPTKKHRPAKKH
jgi:hypothetical protein